jgi:hypothetical protein
MQSKALYKENKNYQIKTVKFILIIQLSSLHFMISEDYYLLIY